MRLSGSNNSAAARLPVYGLEKPGTHRATAATNSLAVSPTNIQGPISAGLS